METITVDKESYKKAIGIFDLTLAMLYVVLILWASSSLSEITSHKTVSNSEQPSLIQSSID